MTKPMVTRWQGGALAMALLIAASVNGLGMARGWEGEDAPCLSSAASNAGLDDGPASTSIPVPARPSDALGANGLHFRLLAGVVLPELSRSSSTTGSPSLWIRPPPSSL